MARIPREQAPRFRFAFDAGGVDEALPLIYLWEIIDNAGEPTYHYVGKAVGGSRRPKAAYRLNVNHLLSGQPYRPGKPDGFRRVHRELAAAVRDGKSIKLTLLENAPIDLILERERFWKRHYQVDLDDAGQDADTIEQRIAEAMILRRVEERLDVALAPAARHGMNFDGLSEKPPIILEIWAHLGPPKPAQKHKVTADALKLAWADKLLFKGGARKVIATADDEAAAPFVSGTWMAEALAGLGIEVLVVPLPEEMNVRLREAQRRQARGNR